MRNRWPSANSVRAAVNEYEAAETVEARCARDADKLEMLLQAVEYREIGVHSVQGWIDMDRHRIEESGDHDSPAGRRIGPHPQ
nr:HD domain-containing protein [Amycolatopsis rhizosphaerae]